MTSEERNAVIEECAQAAMLNSFGAMGNPCCHHTRDNVEQAIIDAIRALKTEAPEPTSAGSGLRIVTDL